jgi:biopolymer transport protein ExbD
MPKIKLPRKSTHIDMTAMCDIAFLLLTFFMLATKFKPEEPVQVITASSTSTKQIPEGFMLITLDKTGRVFFAVDNLNTKKDLIEKINTDKKLGLTQAEEQSFITGSGVGVPFSQLKSYLAMSPAQQKDYDKKATGIPTDTTASFDSNELAYWLQSTRYLVDNEHSRIAIKADGGASYPNLNKVISTLGHQHLFRFSFITNMKGVPAGTALADERDGRTHAQ